MAMEKTRKGKRKFEKKKEENYAERIWMLQKSLKLWDFCCK